MKVKVILQNGKTVEMEEAVARRRIRLGLVRLAQEPESKPKRVYRRRDMQAEKGES